MSIDVMGKTPDEVCDIILRDMGAARHTGGIFSVYAGSVSDSAL